MRGGAISAYRSGPFYSIEIMRQIEVLEGGWVCRLAPRDRLDFDESTMGNVLQKDRGGSVSGCDPCVTWSYWSGVCHRLGCEYHHSHQGERLPR
jgi:hypothetical protein